MKELNELIYFWSQFDTNWKMQKIFRSDWNGFLKQWSGREQILKRVWNEFVTNINQIWNEFEVRFSKESGFVAAVNLPQFKTIELRI